MPGQDGGDLPLRLLHLPEEGGSWKAQGPVAQDDELLRPVGGDHPHPVLPGDLIGGLLDIGVRCLCLLGVHHVDPVPPLHRARVPLYLVGVKDQDDHAPAEALIVGEDILQGPPGGGHILAGQPLQLLPCKDHIVSIHQKVLRPLLLCPDAVLLPIQAGAGGLLLGLEGPLLHLAVGALEDGHQLLILLQ